MAPLDYDGRRFRSVSNSPGGDVSGKTCFDYHQRTTVVWATYEGDGVQMGTLVATATPDGVLDMRYAHVNDAGRLMSGVCTSTPEVLPDGTIRLHERWRWTGGGADEGASIIEEIG